MRNLFLASADLRLFDGAAPAGDGAGIGEGTAVAEIQASPERGRRGKTGERSATKVVYGKQGVGGNPSDGGSAAASSPSQGSQGPAGQDGRGPDAGDRNKKGAPGETQQSGLTGERRSGEANEAPRLRGDERYGARDNDEERKARFEELISGEFKDLFTERTQGIIDKRFKETKGLQGQVAETQPILEMLAQKYGVEGGDLKKLTAAMESDDAYWAQAAEENGMSTAQYREFQKLQRENARFRRAQTEAQGREEAQRQVSAWQAEAEGLKGEYPSFDLRAEIGNVEFLGMLKSGIPVKHAYEVLHLGEIKQSTARASAQQTERQVTETIRAKGARPSEVGAAAASGVTVKSDVSRLSRQDRAEIARRVARGDTIQF